MYEYHDLDEIEEKLWLGNYWSASNVKDLKDKGIKKVISIMDGVSPEYCEEDGFIQKKFKLDDSSFENIIQYFGECLKFIKGDEKVLVHCAAGASRSATIVIAYMMWNKQKSYEEASKIVRDKRPIVYPNTGFREQLKIFEKLLIENKYDIDKINFKEIKWEPKENMTYY